MRFAWVCVMRQVIASIVVSIGLAGCSIHPQTEDFSREYLPDIVYRVRCEARQAILDVIPSDPNDPWSYLRKSGVTFDFQFTLTERDDATTFGGVTFPVTYGSVKIGWDAGLKKERVTTLAVNVTNAFEKLIALPDCEPSARRTFKYPITGNIGLKETFTNFATLARQNTGLFKEFSDQIRFTTDVYASVNPSVRLVPQVGRLVTAEGTLKGQRIDVHQLKMAFSPAEHPDSRKATIAKLKADYLAARELRLSELQAEKDIPERVIILDPDGRPIDPRGPAVSGGGPKGASPQSDGQEKSGDQPPERSRASRTAPPVVRTLPRALPKFESPSDIERRTYDNFRENEQRRFDQQLLEELRRR